MNYFKTVISYRVFDESGKVKKMTKQIITDSADFEHVQKDVIREFERVFEGDKFQRPHDFCIKSISTVEFDYIFCRNMQDNYPDGGWYKAVVRFPDDNSKIAVLISGDNDMHTITESINKHIQKETILDFEVVQVTNTNILSVAIDNE